VTDVDVDFDAAEVRRVAALILDSLPSPCPLGIAIVALFEAGVVLVRRTTNCNAVQACEKLKIVLAGLQRGEIQQEN